jgi:hypothetical protein
MKSESVWSSLMAHGKGRKMVSGKEMICFLQSHKTAVILMFLFILFSISISSAATEPTIKWSNPDNITYGTALSPTQLNAAATDPVNGSTVPGTFVYHPAAGILLSAGNQTLHVDFTPKPS